MVSTALLKPPEVSDEPATLSSDTSATSLPTISGAKLSTNSSWYWLDGGRVAPPSAVAAVIVSSARVSVMVTSSVPPGLV